MLKNNVLWKLENGDKPISFLFGTMHVRDNIAFKHFDRVVNRMALCQQFKCEIDLDEAHAKVPMSAYQINEGKLSDLVSTKRFSKMEHSLRKSFNLELTQFEAFYPIMIVNKITESVLSNDKSFPLDIMLWNKAKELKLETGGVETLEEHLSVLEQLDVNIQIKMLKELLRNTKKFRNSIKSISKLYEDQDIMKLYKVTKKSMGGFRKIMIYDRNLLMANRIFDNQETSCLYAVGAAHLAGKKGVLKYLKQKGYKLTPA